MFDYKDARHAMVESQIRTSDVTDIDVVRAFRSTPREKFVPKAHMALAYGDAHIDLGEGRFMPRPMDFAKMVQAADVKPTDIVLDIACGRGYSTAILAQLAETVVGLEDDAARVDHATKLLIDADITNAAIVEGDLKSGASEHGPFNVIFVNGAVTEPPKTWLDQLANNGRLVTVVMNGPVGRGTVFSRAGDAIGERVLFDANVPALPGFERDAAFVF